MKYNKIIKNFTVMQIIDIESVCLKIETGYFGARVVGFKAGYGVLK